MPAPTRTALLLSRYQRPRSPRSSRTPSSELQTVVRSSGRLTGTPFRGGLGSIAPERLPHQPEQHRQSSTM